MGLGQSPLSQHHPHLTWSHPQQGQKHPDQELGFPHLPSGPGQEEPSKGKRSGSRERQPDQREVLQGGRWRRGSYRKRDGDRDLEGEGRNQWPEARIQRKAGQIRQPGAGEGREKGWGVGWGGVLGNGAGQWQRAEQRPGGCLELGGRSAVPRALAPVLLPSLHLPHFPSALPPHTPQGSRFRFAVESLRGLIPSSVTLHPCGGWRSPCLFPQSRVSPPPPPRPHPPS